MKPVKSKKFTSEVLCKRKTATFFLSNVIRTSEPHTIESKINGDLKVDLKITIAIVEDYFLCFFSSLYYFLI